MILKLFGALTFIVTKNYTHTPGLHLFTHACLIHSCYKASQNQNYTSARELFVRPAYWYPYHHPGIHSHPTAYQFQPFRRSPSPRDTWSSARTDATVGRRVAVPKPYDPGSVGPGAVLRGRQPEAVGVGGAVAEAAGGGARREPEHLDGAGLLQVRRGVEPRGEVDGEVAGLVRRRGQQRVAVRFVAGMLVALAVAGHCYLST